MHTYSVAIVGGGIAGLYIANALLDSGFHVTLIEKSNEVGGRINTVSLGGKLGTIETGAGRFNEKHHLLLRLIRQCGLYEHVQPIVNNERWYLPSKNPVKLYNKYIHEYLFDNIPSWIAKYTKQQLVAITMKELLLLEFPSTTVNNIIGAFGYNSEFEIQNAYTTLRILEKEFNDKIQYYYLQGGLSQVVRTLKSSIISKGGIVKTNTCVNDYDPVNNVLKYNGSSAKFDKVVFACTKNTLSSFNKLIEHDKTLRKYLNSIQMAPLNRMFAIFPVNKTGLAWFHDIKRVTTNHPIRYIIPFNPKLGLIQISYTDNDYARYWHVKPIKDCRNEVITNLRHMFPHKRITQPTWLQNYYWEEGVTYWKPFYKVYRNSKNNNYYIAGEMMSPTHSGWIEGALQSAQNVINILTTR
jgi:hypothetical protein